jgi:hypothetical protein
MISNDKVINNKVVDLLEEYNIDIKFVFIQLCLKSHEFYCVTSILEMAPNPVASTIAIL